MSVYKALKSQWPALLWTIVILVLCNIRFSDGTGTRFFEGFDKMVHLGFFFVLTVLILYGKINGQHNYGFDLMTIVKIIVGCAILGGAIEVLQWKIFTYRSAEWWDFTCDMTGCLMGVFSYVLLHKSNYNEKRN